MGQAILRLTEGRGPRPHWMANLPIELTACLARSLRGLRGRGALGHRLYRAVPAAREGTWSLPMEKGHRMVVPRSSAQTWTAAFTGRYDDEEIDWLAGLMTNGSFILDVGACFGFYTVPLAMAAARVGARVVAFEPVPANVSLLRRNVAENGLDHVVDVMPFGLASQPRTAQVRVESPGFGNAAVVAGEIELGDFTGANIRLERLDDGGLPPRCDGKRCCLVKMDVEGFEMDALAGADGFVRRHRPAIYGEFNEWFLERYGLATDAPLRWADRNDYRCYHVGRRRMHAASDRYAIDLSEAVGTARVPGCSVFLLPREAPAATRARAGIKG